jgi:AraC-like DNA-binding protein
MGAESFYSLAGPLDSMPTERQMRTANLIGFPELVRNRGADPLAILERFGIDPRAIRDPDFYIDCKSLVDVFEHCSRAFNDPLFGLRLAQHQEPDVFGCVAALCRAASTFREAVQSFIDYIPVVHSPGVVMELLEGKETTELRWSVRADLGENRQASLQAVMLELKVLQMMGGRHFHPRYVNLSMDTRSRDVPEIETRLGCRFRSGASTNAIAFPTEALDHPIPSANKLVFRLLGGYLDRVKAESRTTIVQRVEDYVRGSLASGNCSIEHCAHKLGTSVRTLQANLSAYSLKFSDILEKQRIDLAKAYLKRELVSLDDVAAMLGYSEQSSFGRAFKRWTGSTPQRYRQVVVDGGNPDTDLAAAA